MVLNYTTTYATDGNIRKNGSAWWPIPVNTLAAGTRVDANPVPGTYTYALYGLSDSFPEAKFDVGGIVKI